MPSQSSSLSLNRLHADAFWVPAIWIEPDLDDEPMPEPDLDTGSGLGLRLSMQGRNQGVGLLYVTTWHDKRATGTSAQTHSLYADFMARERIYGGTPRTYLAFDGGLGLAWLDFDGPFDESVTGAIQLRGMLEMELGRSFGLQGGIAGFLWGYPGETVAYGSYIFLGAELIF